MNRLPLGKSEFHETLEGGSVAHYLQIHTKGFWYESKDRADFHILQSKLEPVTLRKKDLGY